LKNIPGEIVTGKISGNTITLILFCLSNFCFAQKLSSSKIISSTGAVFQGLGDLPGGSFSSSAQGVSADGKVVVGSGSPDSGALAFVWTEETGMISLGNISDNSFNESWAYGISGNGKVIVGSGDVGNSWNTHKGFVWTQENGMTLIGSLDESERYEAFTASQNGSIIVGDGGQQVFRWTEETGCVGLGTLEGRNASRGVDVSDDGSVIVGSSYNLPNWDSEQAYRWTEEDGIVGLGFLPNSNYSFAIAVSNDGKVIVGTGYADGTYPAFRWTKESGMVNIGHLSGKTTTHPQDLTADGSIIVGGSFQNRGASPAAFIWDENNGMRKLQDVLQNDYGLDLTGWTLAVANGITPDGKVIVGWGTNPEGNQEAFRVELDFEESYLGQTPPGNTPVVFARGIISDELQQHGAPAFSPDAKEVFWQTNYQDENNNWIVA
jgi:probable HAF family extracellular repeat protein